MHKQITGLHEEILLERSQAILEVLLFDNYPDEFFVGPVEGFVNTLREVLSLQVKFMVFDQVMTEAALACLVVVLDHVEVLASRQDLFGYPGEELGSLVSLEYLFKTEGEAVLPVEKIGLAA